MNHFYTSPSAIRKLMKASNTFVEDYELSTLKTIGSGEGLNIMHFITHCGPKLIVYSKTLQFNDNLMWYI